MRTVWERAKGDAAKNPSGTLGCKDEESQKEVECR